MSFCIVQQFCCRAGERFSFLSDFNNVAHAQTNQANYFLFSIQVNSNSFRLCYHMKALAGSHESQRCRTLLQMLMKMREINLKSFVSRNVIKNHAIVKASKEQLEHQDQPVCQVKKVHLVILDMMVSFFETRILCIH